MGLEGALFTFPLCTFAQKIPTSNISPVTFFMHKPFNQFGIYSTKYFDNSIYARAASTHVS
jgi:hypothetical protein